MKTNETILQSYRTSSRNRTTGNTLFLHGQREQEWARFADLAQSNIQSEHGITSSRPFTKQDINFYVTFYVCVF